MSYDPDALIREAAAGDRSTYDGFADLLLAGDESALSDYNAWRVAHRDYAGAAVDLAGELHRAAAQGYTVLAAHAQGASSGAWKLLGLLAIVALLFANKKRRGRRR